MEMKLQSFWRTSQYWNIQNHDTLSDEDCEDPKEHDEGHLPVLGSTLYNERGMNQSSWLHILERLETRGIFIAIAFFLWVVTGLAAFSFWKQLVALRDHNHLPPTAVPFFLPQSAYWAPDLLMGDIPSKESNHAWEALMPVGKGFVSINEDPRNESQKTTYGISAYHQLHCLYMVRERLALTISPEEVKAYQTRLREDYEMYARPDKPTYRIGLDTSIRGTEQGASNHQAVHGDHVGSLHHVFHCMDYLRQAIMCLADPTLEHLNEGGAPGWGDTHICGNWDALTDWSYENRANSSRVGIH